MARQFEEILDECLERLRKGETVEECLARYPEHRRELSPMLKLGASLKLSRSTSPQFRALARYKLLSAIEAAKPQPRMAMRVWWRRGWVMAVTLIVMVLVAGGGTMAAAQGSLPDQPLYPVKIASENIRIGLTPSDMGKARLYAQFAEKRFQEIAEVAPKDRPELVESLMERIDAHLNHVSALVIEARQSSDGEFSKLVQRLEQNLAQAEAKLEAQIQKAPPKSRQALLRALTKAEEKYGSVLKEIKDKRKLSRGKD